MTGGGETADRVRARLDRGEFLGHLLRVASSDSEDVQAHFVREVSKLTRRLRRILEVRGLIHSLEYRPNAYWPAQRGRGYGFIDGGVANLELPTAAPVGIRVGSYVVRPGDETERREAFNIEIAIVDDLFARDPKLYATEESDDPFEDAMKLRDAARIASETAAALKLARRRDGRPDAILLHGPLINPAAPYGLASFPPFQQDAARELLSDSAWEGTAAERGFVRLQRELLLRLEAECIPVVGVVERASTGTRPFLDAILKQLVGDDARPGSLASKHAEKVWGTAKAFTLGDTAIFDLVLRPGEYVGPFVVDRQGEPRKWPKHGELNHWIGRYPKALTTFVKPTEEAQPFRVEAFENCTDFPGMVDLVLHTSRLLPSYVFPVGLDIVDRFSKVPSWLSSGVRTRHQLVLLRKALESGDPHIISYAKKVMASKGRDWLFRPTI